MCKFLKAIELESISVSSPDFRERIQEAAEAHIEWVDTHGPTPSCDCAYCEKKRRESFEETYA